MLNVNTVDDGYMPAPSLPSHPASTPRVEKRRSQRVGFISDAWLSSPTARSGSDRIAVAGLNLSKHGIAFSIDHALPTQAYYVLQMTRGSEHVTREVRTVCCRKTGERAFEVGAEFC